MDPPRPKPDPIEIVEAVEFWLDVLCDDPMAGQAVLPFAEAELARLKGLLKEWQLDRPPIERQRAVARACLRMVTEAAFEIMKRVADGSTCGASPARRIAA